MQDSALWLSAHVGIDESVCGYVVVIDRNLGFNFLLHFARELLTQFDAHLIKGIDMPDHTLNENLVFIERNKATQGFRGQLLIQQ